MGKLWDKGYTLDSLVESFTVGDDYILDMELVPADCAGSLAHAEMLSSIGILTPKEMADLKTGIDRVLEEYRTGKFLIAREDEDCHTALENRLSELAGEAGKKIHTGRSRNDQVLAALRLYGREGILVLCSRVLALARTFLRFAAQNKLIPLPGRTHMQPAMPASVGLWAASFAEDLLDGFEVLKALYPLNNRCPLGSAASYGVPLPLDREMVSRLLGFAEPHHNVLSANNARGRIELLLLQGAEHIALVLGKAASDMILFSLPEFGYFVLPDELCSGSSIMPQKKNPDGLELVRAKAGTISSYADRVRNVIRNLPSGYNRDFQETKEPFLKGLSTAIMCADIIERTVSLLSVNAEKLLKGFTPDIFATDAALESVAAGKSFREAYKEVGTNLSSLSRRDPVGSLVKRDYPGAPGRLELEKIEASCAAAAEWTLNEKNRIEEIIGNLTGTDQPLFRIMGVKQG